MRLRWIGLGFVLALTMASSTFSPVIFSVLASTLLEEFDAARWQIGVLVAFNFMVGSLVSTRLGALTDRISPLRATAFTLMVASIGYVLLALAPGYWWFAAAAAFAGFAQGASNPSTNRLIMTNADAGNRGLLTGIKQAGVQVGNVFGGILLPIGAVSYLGWRGSVAAVALVPLIGLSVLAFVRRSDTDTSGGTTRSLVPVSPVVRRVALFAGLMGLTTGGLFTYLSLFAQEDFGLSAAGGGALVSTFGAVGFVARLSIGRLSERYFGHRHTLMGLAVLTATAAVLLALSSAVGLLWVAAVLIGLGAMSWNVVANVVVMEVSPLAGAGRASGVMNAGFLAGYAIGPPVFGWSVDVLGTYRPGWWAVAGLACGGAVLASRLRVGVPRTVDTL